MRNTSKCGCSFSQSNASFAGERIHVNNSGCCNNSCGCGNHRNHCQDSCRPKPCPPKPCRPKPCPQPCPKPCPPRPCPPRPCRPKPCPPRPCPSCEDRCASQYRNCMRNCRWENENRCGCRNDFDNFNDSYNFGNDCGCMNRRPYYGDRFDDYGMNDGFQPRFEDSYDDGMSYANEYNETEKEYDNEDED